MKAPVLTVVAHPDDESFGPAGLIYHLSRDGHPCHLLMVTDGAHSRRYRHERDIKTRWNELLSACSLLGYTTVEPLHFEDGSLCNNTYHQLTEAVGAHIDKIRPETIVTFEPRGLSGHIDHIVVTSVVDYLFTRKQSVKTIYYLNLPKELRQIDYFVHMPEGKLKSEVDHVEDISDAWEIKKRAILCHQSQVSDMSSLLRLLEQMPKEEWYTVRRKD